MNLFREENEGDLRLTHSAVETYIHSEITLMDKQASNEKLYIEAGNHSFPFNFILPQNLPTSFEHSIGFIRYSIQATLDIYWYIIL